MSPEYAMTGMISVKSDVYSFGVLLLEILSGKRNNGNMILLADVSLSVVLILISVILNSDESFYSPL